MKPKIRLRFVPELAGLSAEDKAAWMAYKNAELTLNYDYIPNIGESIEINDNNIDMITNYDTGFLSDGINHPDWLFNLWSVYDKVIDNSYIHLYLKDHDD